MRRKSKQISAMLLAAMLAMTSMSNPVSASTSKQQAKTEGKATKEVKSAPYKEGEAVVMYYGTKAQRSNAQGSQAFGDDITVEKTYDFTPEQSMQASTIARNSEELLVSKVSSKTYDTEELVEKLQGQANVEYAEPNYIYKINDNNEEAKYMPYEWALKNVGQNGGIKGCDVNVESAWEQKTGTDKVIAVVDTGVDYTHPDLSSNIWQNPYTDQLKGEHGYDFVNHDDDPMDDQGHGSHCSGSIAGNGKGIAGINKTAKIMGLKFLSAEGEGELDGAIGAYDYINRALNLGVNVVAVNNSWGGGEGSPILKKVIDIVGAKGAISVASAGNDYTDVDVYGNAPWDFTSDYLIKVAATNEKDEVTNFSNYGKTTIDLGAPGANILSTVCTDTYNPAIHVGDNDYSEMIDTFESKEEVDAYKTMTTAQSGEVKLAAGKGKGFGATPNNSLEFKVDNAEAGKWYYAYRPITLPESATDYYVGTNMKPSGDKTECSMIMGISKMSDLEKMDEKTLMADKVSTGAGDVHRNYWKMASVDTGKKEFKADDQYAVWFALYTDKSENIEVQLDNVAFSKKDMKPESFGKYSFYNGTSMAAPQVTGAVAMISELAGDMDPHDLRETVVKCVRKADDLEAKTITGGVLDLSKVKTLAPVVNSVTADKDTITIKGSCFGKEQGSVTINGKTIAVKSWSTNEIVLNEKATRNKEVSLKITTTANNVTEKSVYVDFNQTEIKELGEVYNAGGSISATDGEQLYVLDEFGNLTSYENETGESVFHESLQLSLVDPEAIETDASRFTYRSQLVYANHGLYTIADYDTEFYSTKALVYYDIENGTWSKAADLPAELGQVHATTLASYRDTLYLIGGYDTKEGKVLNTVYSFAYSKADATFKKEKATIPARFGAVAQVVDNKLVLTLGGDGTVDQNINDDSYVAVPNNIVFDGTSWKEVKNSSFAPESASYYRIKGDTGIAYYTAQIGSYRGGIIYTDLYSKEFGNVFTYDLKKNQYSALPCSLYNYTKDGDVLCGTTVADEFMFVAGEKLYAFDVDTKSNEVLATKLKLNKKLVLVRANESYTLKADIQPAEVSSTDLIWESSNPSVATVSETGEVTAHSQGAAVITARTTDGSNLTAKCEVVVLRAKK